LADRLWYWQTCANPEWPFGDRPRRVAHPLAERRGQVVREVCRGRNGNALLEFEDGYRTVAPWRAARREKAPQASPPVLRGPWAPAGRETPAQGLARPESALGWELRGHMAAYRIVRLTLSPSCDGVPENAEGARVLEGRITSVSPTDAFVIIRPTGARTRHVPLEHVMSCKRPHHTDASPSDPTDPLEKERAA
jgi:hypothetical protein